jgi:RNA polymerase sigma-70 factor (ECF subfamily)
MLYFQQLIGATGVSSINWCTCSSAMKNPLDLSDERALALAAQGDQEAFGVLYERYIGRIYNYIYYRTGNQHDAEDLTARVFFRALRHIENYTDRGLPFSAWLYRIAHNLVANWHRDNSRRKEVPLEDMIWIYFNSEHPEVALLQNEEQEGLLLVIRNLPADRQQLLILKFVEHLSNAEIGLIMGRTEGAVKSLYHRTLLSLRDGYLRVKHNGSENSEELV